MLTINILDQIMFQLIWIGYSLMIYCRLCTFPKISSYFFLSLYLDLNVTLQMGWVNMMNSGFEVGMVFLTASCLFNDWAVFTEWTSEQCFHVLKIPVPPVSCTAGHPVKFVLHCTGLHQSRRGCCFLDKGKLSETFLNWSSSLNALSWNPL